MIIYKITISIGNIIINNGHWRLGVLEPSAKKNFHLSKILIEWTRHLFGQKIQGQGLVIGSFTCPESLLAKLIVFNNFPAFCGN